jgi:hypothetical protein
VPPLTARWRDSAAASAAWCVCVGCVRWQQLGVWKGEGEDWQRPVESVTSVSLLARSLASWRSAPRRAHRPHTERATLVPAWWASLHTHTHTHAEPVSRESRAPAAAAPPHAGVLTSTTSASASLPHTRTSQPAPRWQPPAKRTSS